MYLANIDEIRKVFNVGEWCKDCPHYGKFCNASRVFSLMDICSRLDEIETIDAEPVRHGYDKSDYYPYCDFKCSVCNKEIKEFWTDYKVNYCPFCGAKMDMGVNNDLGKETPRN